MIIHALEHAILDTIKVIPFLFIAFLIIEALEHFSGNAMNRMLGKVGKAGPVVGALFGCVPQCGFSVAAANLYSGGIVTLGTLLAVFLSTSDEAVLIFLSHPGNGSVIGKLLLAKISIAVVVGFLLDILLQKRKEEKHIEDMCRNCGCSEASGVWRPALSHTIRLTVYLLLFTFVLNVVLESVGIENLGLLLGKDTWYQPFLTALIGLIPNCASSVLITELYLADALSFGSAIAGLCAGAGVGLAVLFKSNHPFRENVQILLLLYGISVAAGIIV